MSSAPATVVTYPLPDAVPQATDMAVKVNGQVVPIVTSDFARFASFSCAGPVDVEFSTTLPFERLTIRPLSRQIVAERRGQRVRFQLAAPMHLSLELDADIRRPLFLFANPLEENVPRKGDANVLFLEAGKVHRLGPLAPASGQTIYLEGGAVLESIIHTQDQHDIAIRGRGILSSGYLHRGRATPDRPRTIRPVNCRNVLIEGITVFDAPSWNIVPTHCNNVHIDNVKVLGSYANDDGLDLCSCQDVLVERCFIRTKDDCIAIKAFPRDENTPSQDVRGLLIRDSTFWNAEWGNALEIGYECRAARFSDITFTNCDVIRCEPERYSSGGVLTIHNGDRADIHDVLYENIRVEDAREKLIDFKILHERYSRDEQRGQVHHVTVRNVQVSAAEDPVSIVSGFNGDHRVRNVTLEDITFRGTPVANPQQLHLVTERTAGLKFIVNGRITWEK